MKKDDLIFRRDPLWKTTFELARQMYNIAHQILELHPDEQWATVNKLRTTVNDCMFHVSQSVGAVPAEVSVYDLNNARKNLFTLQSMYIFATKQQFISLDPEIVVTIDSLIADVDNRIKSAEEFRALQTQKDLEPWLEKYRLWQKMQD